MNEKPSPAGPAPRAQSSSTARMGMRLLLASLSMLFGASLMGYLVSRSRAAVWPPPGVPSLPAGLWFSTVLILAGSFTVYLALDGIRHGRARAARIGLVLTLVLGLAFLASQTVNWFALVAAHFTMRTTLYGFMFYLLTGLHAAHVVGGLIPLGLTAVRARQGRYTAESHAGIEYVSMYWHFLAVVWLILFGALLLTS